MNWTWKWTAALWLVVCIVMLFASVLLDATVAIVLWSLLAGVQIGAAYWRARYDGAKYVLKVYHDAAERCLGGER